MHFLIHDKARGQPLAAAAASPARRGRSVCLGEIGCSWKFAAQELGERKTASLADENDEEQQAEVEGNASRDQHVRPPDVRVNVGGVEPPRAFLLLRGVAGGASELVEEVQVHAEPQLAGVLHPADPDGDLVNLHVEACEEDQRDEDYGRCLNRLLCVFCYSDIEERCRRSAQADEPGDEDVEDQGASQANHPVGDEKG